VLFSIRSRLNGKRVAYVDFKDHNSIKIRKAKNNVEERFFFDPMTGLIHSAKDSTLAMNADKQGSSYQLAVKSF
jgi:hypothetical protein